ncbi:MAG TPA: hypothetical protein VM328_02705 [Fimbriimonadaceae bacterium]|nr:hypothetical protein [Fimbriimonadaceae bacterium]
MFLAQTAPPSFFNGPPGSTELWIKIGLALVFGFGMMIAFMAAPTRARRPIVATFTFLAGLFWVLYYLWPTAANRSPDDIPRDLSESVAFWLEDAVPIVGGFANILTAFLLGLGIYSLVRIHSKKLAKMQKDWPFSLVLLLSMVFMVVFGYMDWYQRKIAEGGSRFELPENWGLVQYGKDLFFDGLLQQMDAAMFSLIAFFILSAAYRAFRIRSVEATILLSAALIVLLSLLGGVEFFWNERIRDVTGGNPDHFANNFTLTSVAAWIRGTFQTPSLRAIEFGIGIGALAMGLRLWLSLERGGVSS